MTHKSPQHWALEIHASFARESDRAAAIVAAAMLDDALLTLLEARLVPPTKKGRSLLAGGHSPLGTFSARIDAAFQLGLISGFLARDLHTIRKIRNAFAHDPFHTTFESSPIADWIGVLESASDYNTRHSETREAMGPPGRKGDFLGIVAWILYTLENDVAETARIQEHTPEFGYIRFEDLPAEVRKLLASNDGPGDAD